MCNTLPALDLYFAVNRQIPSSHPPFPSFESSQIELDWKICKPGENPQQVKTKQRYWAQVVACVVKQSEFNGCNGAEEADSAPTVYRLDAVKNNLDFPIKLSDLSTKCCGYRMVSRFISEVTYVH
ncbi:hypothetical protein V6N13_147451 [Hibiscus sabdariffa]